MLILLLLLVLSAAIRPTPAGAQDVTGQIEGVLFLAQDALTEWFARTQPLPSAAPGVSYSFDPATGNFRRDPATFGQIYLERADPLGKGRFNVSFAYQYTELDQLEGMDAGDLTDSLPIPFEGLLAAMEIPNLHLDAAVHSLLFAATYGVTDNLDVSLAVPVMISDLDVRTSVAAAGLTEDGELILFEDDVDDSSHPAGFGDVLLRAKYRVLELHDLHAATGLLLRLPSGDKDDLQGTGFVEVAPSLLASTRIFEPAADARFQGHFNVAIGFNANDVSSSDARWGIGLDWGVTESATFAIAILGRHPFSRIGPHDAFDLPRCSSDLISCAVDPSQRDTTAPLFGLTGERSDYYTASLGGRAGLWRDTIFGFLNVAVPLNDAFVRTKPIPMIGIEATL
jgi:hypothetical protein